MADGTQAPQREHLMELPKCRTCGERHRLGGCPSNANKSRGVVESKNTRRLDDPKPLETGTAKGDGPAGSERASKVGRPTKSIAGVAPSPRDAKPAKKAKPKKEKANGKSATQANRKKNKVRKPDPKRRSKGHHRPELPGSGASQSVGAVDASHDLPASAGDVAKFAPGQIKVGPPRKGEEHKTLTATKPWEKLGMSRPSWYRKGKPMPPEAKR